MCNPKHLPVSKRVQTCPKYIRVQTCPTVSKTKVAASKATATASTLKKVATAPTKSKLREVATPQSPSPASARSISISETGKSPLSRRSASVPPSMHGDPIREMANTTGEAFSAATQAFLNQHGDATQLLGLEGYLFDTSSSSS